MNVKRSRGDSLYLLFSPRNSSKPSIKKQNLALSWYWKRNDQNTLGAPPASRLGYSGKTARPAAVGIYFSKKGRVEELSERLENPTRAVAFQLLAKARFALSVSLSSKIVSSAVIDG